MGLVITRKSGQRIILTGILKEGEEVSIEVNYDGGDRTKVYIKAPDSIRILREELIDPEEIDDSN